MVSVRKVLGVDPEDDAYFGAVAEFTDDSTVTVGGERLAQRRAALPPQLPPAEEKARVEELRRAAKADLPDRLGRISRITGLKYNKLTIRASRTKWGSCTGTNNISLSLFLMVLPEHLRDFVIVHELCHTVHHDHSPKFHALVDRLVGGNEKALNRELRAFTIR
jgi:predicted metal-dependent hydrolase